MDHPDEAYHGDHNTVAWVQWLLTCSKQQAIAVIGYVIAFGGTITGAYQALYSIPPRKESRRRGDWARL